jgi:nucleoside phosphorylase
MTQEQDLVVILTALNLEHDAVRDRLVDTELHYHPKGTLFETGTIRGTRHRIALSLVGKGNHASAVLAERAVDEFAPVAVLFAGVAGGLRKTARLGDVVIASHVYSYHGGTSQDDGLKSRPRVWEISHGIHQIAGHLSRTGGWADPVRPGDAVPQALFGPIAAGEVLHNSQTSYEAEHLRLHYNDALAVDMEAAGVAVAGHLGDIPTAIIRGISDRADGTKTTDADRSWQPRAAANAAAFAVRLAAELLERHEASKAVGAARTTSRAANGTPERTTAREARAMSEHQSELAAAALSGGGSVVNIASGSNIGIQGGWVSGSTVVMRAQPAGQSPLTLAAELAAVRELLVVEHAAGRLDSVTFEAAEAELTIAEQALPPETPERKSTFILALKRLRGLISDVADVATRVMALLVTAKEL